MVDYTEAELAAWWEREGQYRRATQASAPADLLGTLPELSTRLAAAAKNRVVVGYSKRALCEEAHAAIQALAAHLRAPATGGKPSPVDATASLIDAARAVVDRWHAPVWKEVEHTAAFIARLDEAATRAAGAAPQHQGGGNG